MTFIVIEGGDCTGKTTQANLLIGKLTHSGKQIKVLDFPTYEKTLGGKTVKWYQENREWWQEIKSGSFKKYYSKMYGRRIAVSREGKVRK